MGSEMCIRDRCSAPASGVSQGILLASATLSPSKRVPVASWPRGFECSLLRTKLTHRWAAACGQPQCHLQDFPLGPISVCIKKHPLPWLGGSGGQSVLQYAKRLWVRFPVRARTWVVGLIPSQVVYGRQPIDVSPSLSLSLSLPSSLSKIKIE